MPKAPKLEQVDRTYVVYGGRRLSYFGGCDYFRMASHPEVLEALREGLIKFGLNVSASRLTTGNHRIYEELENELARFFKVESATLAGNGYAPSLMAAQAMEGRFSHALIDERAHGCLTDAALLLACPVVKFRHRDTDDFGRTLKRLGISKPMVLTDGMFSHDGGVAPIGRYLAALPKGGAILVDDAHGAGVIGATGRGTQEHVGVSSKAIIQTVTLSKAFGVYGGAVLGGRELKSEILERSRLYVGSTPLPLPLAGAAIRSLAILRADKSLRRRLQKNADQVKEALAANGWPIWETPSSIISLTPGNAKEQQRLTRRLLAAGILPPFIHYPGGPEGGHFRFMISSEHSGEQLEGLVEALGKADQRLKIGH